MLPDGERLGDALALDDADADGLTLGDGETDGLTLDEGEADELGETDVLADAEALELDEGEIDGEVAASATVIKLQVAEVSEPTFSYRVLPP